MTIINILTNKYDLKLTNYLIQSSTNQVRNSDTLVYTAHVLASKQDVVFISLNRRMPNCTTVVQTASNLFEHEIRLNSPKK